MLRCTPFKRDSLVLLFHESLQWQVTNAMLFTLEMEVFCIVPGLVLTELSFWMLRALQNKTPTITLDGIYPALEDISVPSLLWRLPDFQRLLLTTFTEGVTVEKYRVQYKIQIQQQNRSKS